MASEWYYSDGLGEVGPISSTELRQLAKAGTIRTDSKIRRGDMPNAIFARQVKGLFADPAVEMPPMPAPAPAPISEPPAPPPSEPLFKESAPSSYRRPVPVMPKAPVPASSLFPKKREPPTKPAIELPQLDWRNLWPLATVVLILGWIVGGFLSGDRLYGPTSYFPILLLAVGAVPVALAAMVHYLRPHGIPLGRGIGITLFTAIGGILLLLLLQFFASAIAHGGRVPHGRGAVLWAVMYAIGTAYEWTHSGNVVQRFIGFVFGVGLCEEAVKLLPLVWVVLSNGDRRMNIRDFLLLGFFSGLGFGIGEAVFCYAPWNGNYGFGSNLIRWFSAVPSHAIYSTVCAAFLWKLRDRLVNADGFWERAAVVAMAVAAIALLHGLYDTVCSFGIVPSLIVEIGSFILLAIVVPWVATDNEGPPIASQLQFASVSRRPKLMALNLAGLLAVFGAAAAFTGEKTAVMPLILRAELPEEYWRYIDGYAQEAAHAKIGCSFRFDPANAEIVGTFVNHTGAAIEHLSIVCLDSDGEESQEFTVDNLATDGTYRLDDDAGWTFDRGETVTVSDDEGSDRIVLP